MPSAPPATLGALRAGAEPGTRQTLTRPRGAVSPETRPPSPIGRRRPSPPAGFTASRALGKQFAAQVPAWPPPASKDEVAPPNVGEQGSRSWATRPGAYLGRGRRDDGATARGSRPRRPEEVSQARLRRGQLLRGRLEMAAHWARPPSANPRRTLAARGPAP